MLLCANAVPNGIGDVPVLFYRLYFAAFDGTWDIFPRDLTNVTRFFNRYRGVKKYYRGIGANSAVPGDNDLLSGAFGLQGHAVVKQAMTDLSNYLSSEYAQGGLNSVDSQIDIVGFSRGGALALEFGNEIWSGSGVTVRGGSERGCFNFKPLIRFAGLFDPVGSFNVGVLGLPNLGWDLSSGESYWRFIANAKRAPDSEWFYHQIHVDATAEQVFPYDHHGLGTRPDTLEWIIQQARSQNVPVN